MAVLSESLGYLFIMAPRTGCTALSVHLVKTLQGEWFPPEDVKADDGAVVVERKHSKVADLVHAELIGRPRLHELHVFTSVRNPFDSLVSLYTKLVNQYVPLLDDPEAFIHRKPRMLEDIRYAQDHDFSDWIVWKYGDLERSRSRHLYAGYIDDVDTIMHFERLQDDFDAVMASLGVTEGTEIPVLNVTDGRPESYRDMYSRKARKVVERTFQADLDRFDYRF